MISVCYINLRWGSGRSFWSLVLVLVSGSMCLCVIFVDYFQAPVALFLGLSWSLSFVSCVMGLVGGSGCFHWSPGVDMRCRSMCLSNVVYIYRVCVC